MRLNPLILMAAAATAAAVNAGEVVPRANRGPSPKAKRAYRATASLQEPNGLTFKSLRRAVNSGWEPPQPTEEAKLRHVHPRHRRELARKKLCESPGQ